MEEVLSCNEYWASNIYPTVLKLMDNIKKDVLDMEIESAKLDPKDKKFKSNYGKLVSSSENRDYFFKKLRNTNLTFDDYMKENKDRMIKFIMQKLNKN